MRGARLTALAAAVLAAAPSIAAACPTCATREGAGTATWVLVGLMISVPYAVTAVAVKVIRRLSSDPPGEDRAP